MSDIIKVKKEKGKKLISIKQQENRYLIRRRNMKKYLKEIVILFIQLVMFYIFPLFMYLYGPIGTVMLIIVTTFILSIVLSLISKNKIKYLYPLAISIIFIPSIYIYYNESALVHSIWYLVVSATGLSIGTITKIITRKAKKHEILNNKIV